ncbi:MAG: hypothetical protein LIP15_11695 [Clostridium sp.]|nr:hypothetical protein [Clostridium sp.]
MEEKKITMITLRLKKEVAIAYKKYLIDKHLSVTEDLTAHIERQSQHYQLIDDYEPMKTTSKEYTKLGIRINLDTYATYKKKLVENSTNTTADCTRYILKTIYDEKEKEKFHEY